MKGSDIRRIRTDLGLTQGQLAQVLGVHAITISKWENDKASPTAWCAGLLAMVDSNDHPKEAGERAKLALMTGGTARAIYELMRHSEVAALVEEAEEILKGPSGQKGT